MTQFFIHAPDNPSIGSPVYAQSVLRYYYQNFLSGMVEIHASTEHFIFLYSEGSPVGAYRLEGERYNPFSQDKIAVYWKTGEARIRSVTLPREGVRAIKGSLEWFPPALIEFLPSIKLSSFLEECQAQQSSGFLHLRWERAEGFLTLYLGAPVIRESVYASPVEVQAGAESYRQMLIEAGQFCQVSFYPALSGSQGHHLHLLRFAFSALVCSILQRYIHFVGRAMANALLAELNGSMRSKSFYIQVIGESISDTHVHSSANSCVKAYQVFTKLMLLHIAKVIGANLTQQLFDEALQKVNTQERELLAKYALVPALTLS